MEKTKEKRKVGRPRKYATKEIAYNAQLEKYRAKHPYKKIIHLQGEVWKPIIGYEGLYEISNLGRVKSLKGVRILKNSTQKVGYETVGLRKNNQTKVFYIHRLVAEAYIPNIENKPFIDHINRDKTDNRVENLRWVTQKENINNPLTKNIWGYTHNKNVSRLRGENHPNARKIQQFTKDGVFIEEWGAAIEAANKLGFKYASCITACCRGKGNTAYGFIWKYAV